MLGTRRRRRRRRPRPRPRAFVSLARIILTRASAAEIPIAPVVILP